MAPHANAGPVPTATSYDRPTSLEEAIAALGSGARVLAGGTDLLVQLRRGGDGAGRLIDVKRIPELGRITESSEGFRIGAALCAAELCEHGGLAAAWPGLVEATDLIGSTQIQGRATLGGNVCNASPAADTVPALIAARATADVVGPEGARTVDVADIATGPGQTSLGPGELVTSFHLPTRRARSADAYLRMIPRSEMDIAIAGAGVDLSLDEDGRVSECRVVIGAVAPTARLVPGAGEALIGTGADDAALHALEAAASAAADPIDDVRGSRAYRIRVVGVLARRAALRALERARSRV